MTTNQPPSPALVRAAMKPDIDRLSDEEKMAYFAVAYGYHSADYVETDRDILRAHIAATAQAMREEADMTNNIALHYWADQLEGKEP